MPVTLTRREQLQDGERRQSAQRSKPLLSRLYEFRVLYLFALPGIAFFGVFAYIPLLGNLIAFQDYRPLRGISGSKWVGFANFAALFSDSELVHALLNTLIIALIQIVFAFPAPIMLAILLNSLVSGRLRSAVQTVIYLPHFLSWVIVISIWQSVLGGVGPVSSLFAVFGHEGVNIMTNADSFKFLLAAQVIWKDVGWGTIIFFAALQGIPDELYESSAIDGAGWFRRIWHITLPGILPTVTLLLILTVGNVLSVGFEQLYLQRPAVGAQAAEVVDTFVYYRGIVGGDFGFSTAAGLTKGIVGTLLVVGANALSKRLGSDGIL